MAEVIWGTTKHQLVQAEGRRGESKGARSVASWLASELGSTFISAFSVIPSLIGRGGEGGDGGTLDTLSS